MYVIVTMGLVKTFAASPSTWRVFLVAIFERQRRRNCIAERSIVEFRKAPTPETQGLHQLHLLDPNAIDKNRRCHT